MKIEELIEQIRAILPEYAGYDKKEYMADSDRVLRHNLAREMEKFKRELQAVREKFFLEGKLLTTEGLEDIVLRMERLEGEFGDLKTKTTEDAEVAELSEDDMERLYNYDIALLDLIEALRTPLDKLGAAGGSSMGVQAEECGVMMEILGRIEKHYEGRRGLISNS